MNPGPGFGGSCFPKDILAILNVAKENKVNLSLIDSVTTSNNQRKIRMAQKITTILGGNVAGKKIALLGLAFKANTDDIRYSPAIVIAKELAKNGAEICATDPEGIENSKRELAEFKNIKFAADAYEASENADLIVIATEWKNYRELDFSKIKTKKIVDLRNLFDAEKMKNLGFEYFYIGQKI